MYLNVYEVLLTIHAEAVFALELVRPRPVLVTGDLQSAQALVVTEEVILLATVGGDTTRRDVVSAIYQSFSLKSAHLYCIFSSKSRTTSLTG